MLTKMVNGETVICDAEEEAALRLFWDENDPAKQPAQPAKPTLEDVLAVIQGDPALSAKLDAHLAAKEAK